MRKYLIILDLNGTLLHRLTKPAEQQMAKSHPKYVPAEHKLSTNKQPVYLRPHLDHFLKTLKTNKRLEVAVWTSAMEHNAQAMINCLPSYMGGSFKFVWGQGKCLAVPQPGESTPIFQKPLSQVLTEYKNEFERENVLIVDDSQEKFLEEDRLNHVCLPEYSVCLEDVDFTKDDALMILSDWITKMLSEIEEKESLVSYLKAHPPQFESKEVHPPQSEPKEPKEVKLENDNNANNANNDIKEESRTALPADEVISTLIEKLKI